MCHISVLLASRGPGLSFCVEDDGAWIIPMTVPPGRLGLVGMRERIETLGGTLQIASAPEQGAMALVSIAMQAGGILDRQ
jgi:signal transduction histidine kinase